MARSIVTADRVGELPFQAHVELLRLFLAHRDEIVERLQEALNAQRKPAQYLQDRRLLARRCEDCFFTLAAITRDQSALRNQLEEAHWASGFRPRDMPGMHNDLIDPAEMMIRGFHLWRQTRWPGRSGRIRYAHTLFNLYVIRRLALLSMRVWDAGSGSAGDRLARLQGVLDQLWRIAPSDQPVLVRDARWLIPLAQSPTTDELAPYFEVAERITLDLPAEDRIEVLEATVQTAGGHLRSQLRHYCMKKGVSLDEGGLTLTSRNSNALDFAVLIQGLVPLLEAYEDASRGGDGSRRLELAGAICQGISADPELFVNRLDLLGAYSMIEHLFITTDGEGRAVHSPIGRRHVDLLRRYEALMRRLSKALHEDCLRFRPIADAYSPYGVIYGFSSNLLEHMALKTLQPEAVTRFSLEDVFTDGRADKLAWVDGWRKLPHIDEEVRRRFEYPQQFAEEVFERVEHALHRRVCGGEADAAGRTGRLFILSGDGPEAAAVASRIADLPVRFVGSSDAQMVAEHRAHSYDEARLLRERQEGMFAVSYRTSGGWVAISKDVLTELLGAGHDAKVTWLPGIAAGVLRLVCRSLAALPEDVAARSPPG